MPGFLGRIGFELTKSGQTTGAGSRRADYINPTAMGHVLAALMPVNRLAIEVAIATGLRISDVLSLKTAQLLKPSKSGKIELQERITVRETKTGKTRRIYLPTDLRHRMALISGTVYVFAHRNDEYRHRSRQAIAKDILRARQILRAPKSLVVSAHTARKMYAVDIATRKGNKAAQAALLHTDPSVTEIYALADLLTRRHMRGKRADLYGGVDDGK